MCCLVCVYVCVCVCVCERKRLWAVAPISVVPVGPVVVFLVMRFTEARNRKDGGCLYLGVVLGEAVFAQVMDKVGVVGDARLLLVHRCHVEPETKLRVAGQLGVLRCVVVAFHSCIIPSSWRFVNPKTG